MVELTRAVSDVIRDVGPYTSALAKPPGWDDGYYQCFGFTYEGTCRRHLIVKGRNRDTAWFSVIDEEWPAVRAGFEAWLAPENFDGEGRQLRTLEQLRAA